MSNFIELAAERLTKLKPEIHAALAVGPNESDTRLKVLDRFLFEVLDWQKDSSVYTEPPTDSGYIDYLLTIGESRGVMVVEAKRKGKLEPATKSSDMMHVALSGPVVRPLMFGIKQAMGDLREAFVRYILKIDSGRVTIPGNRVYAQIAMARRQIDKLTSQGRQRSRAVLASGWTPLTFAVRCADVPL